MELAIADDPDGRVPLVVQKAVIHAGLDLEPEWSPQGGAWWRAGLADALSRAPTSVAEPTTYIAARSPRKTCGATRA